MNDPIRRMSTVTFDPPTSFDDPRDVRIMWLWKSLEYQVAAGNLTAQTRDRIMRDCFPPAEEASDDQGS